MTEPIQGQPAADGKVEGQEPGAGVSGQQPSTPPAEPKDPQQPVGQNQPQGGGPAKTPHEIELERRLAGQDRLIRSLKNRGSQTPANPASDDPNAEMEELRLFKAESMLKDAAKDLLEQYPDFPKNVAKAILKNPRGFVQTTTTSVDDAVIDLEEYIAGVWEEHLASGGGSSSPAAPQPTVAAPNAGVSSVVNGIDLDTASAEEIDAAVNAGTLTEQDLENYVRNKGHERAK